MCVICYKPAGVDMPDLETLRQAASFNRDGFGFCTPNSSFKTLFFGRFIERLKTVSKDTPCLIHCRWATQGSVKTANCHPFKDEESGVYFMHNGVLYAKERNDMTDSEINFRDFVAPAINQFGYGSDKADEVINLVRGSSRFAIMKGSDVRLYGDFIERDGCYYSNLRFLPQRLHGMHRAY